MVSFTPRMCFNAAAAAIQNPPASAPAGIVCADMRDAPRSCGLLGLNEAAVAALKFVAELGVHQHPCGGTLENRTDRRWVLRPAVPSGEGHGPLRGLIQCLSILKAEVEDWSRSKFYLRITCNWGRHRR